MGCGQTSQRADLLSQLYCKLFRASDLKGSGLAIRGTGIPVPLIVGGTILVRGCGLIRQRIDFEKRSHIRFSKLELFSNPRIFFVSSGSRDVFR